MTFGSEDSEVTATDAAANSEAEELRKSKVLRKRKAVVEELLQTERSYVQDLELLLRVFLTPLREKEILSKQELSALFSNIESLLPVNEHLLVDLEARFKYDEEKASGEGATDAVPEQGYGAIFANRGAHFKLYAVYCGNQHNVQERLEDLCAKNSDFKPFLDKCFRLPECRALGLDSFLILPLQRICKYPLLLRTILECTDKDDDDYEALQTALACTKEVLDKINAHTKKAENVGQLLKVASRLLPDQDLDLVKPGRSLRHEGTFQLNSHKRLKDYVGFLCNDIMLLCIKEKNNDLLKVRKKIEGFRLGVVDIPDEEDSKNIFQISELNGKTYRCLVEDQYTKDRWLKQLREVAEAYATSEERVALAKSMIEEDSKTPRSNSKKSGIFSDKFKSFANPRLSTRSPRPVSSGGFPGVRQHVDKDVDGGSGAFPGIRQHIIEKKEPVSPTPTSFPGIRHHEVSHPDGLVPQDASLRRRSTGEFDGESLDLGTSSSSSDVPSPAPAMTRSSRSSTREKRATTAAPSLKTSKAALKDGLAATTWKRGDLEDEQSFLQAPSSKGRELQRKDTFGSMITKELKTQLENERSELKVAKSKLKRYRSKNHALRKELRNAHRQVADTTKEGEDAVEEQKDADAIVLALQAENRKLRDKLTASKAKTEELKVSNERLLNGLTETHALVAMIKGSMAGKRKSANACAIAPVLAASAPALSVSAVPTVSQPSSTLTSPSATADSLTTDDNTLSESDSDLSDMEDED
eukprot:TRINITY_DN9334_c0_g1_i1.p1 TRINITY_DN9334_c0_g1~~TRINITY_DN9334_c0_g1_i1.p1  ORF type:complete len:755 (-),score=167.03 TRINITY_DN9334_c0_g1_i1:68-2332(-)